MDGSEFTIGALRMQTKGAGYRTHSLGDGGHDGPWLAESSKSRSGSHMHCLLFHIWAELRAQRLLGYQIHRVAQQVFNVELDTEVRP